MADKFIEIKGVTNVLRELKKLQDKGENMRDVLAEVANKIKNITEKSFDNQASPAGAAWKANKQSKYKKYSAGKKILIDYGDLKDIRSKVTADSIVISSDREYAAIHQFGGNAGRGKKIVIPARPYFPIDQDGKILPDVEKEIVEMLHDWFTK